MLDYRGHLRRLGLLAQRAEGAMNARLPVLPGGVAFAASIARFRSRARQSARPYGPRASSVPRARRQLFLQFPEHFSRSGSWASVHT
jgi:hypothetical protein